ncbi:hypothetical protein F5Y15DRAFT_410049 [Xylariaceae sp. FL0016]|nr:hypothetical protein F5Y15DRAFT_410049 [Xylariaceae sp. FL0016]
MKVSHTLAFVSLATAAVLPRTNSKSPKALYFLENDPAGANIVSLGVSANGALGNPVRTSTGGKGLIGVNAMGPAPMDTLFSQDAVVVSGNHLLTVNPGSNSISLFSIPPHDASHPVLIANVPSGGEFPNTMAYSSELNLACVANSGAVNTVQCFDVTEQGLTPNCEAMPLPLVNQTTPPLGPANTASDVVFHPRGTAVFVSVKGTGAAGAPGYIYAYPVVGGRVQSAPRVSRPAELGTDFSFSFLDREGARAFVTDPGFGGAFVEIGCSLDVRVTQTVNVTGQTATCWGQYDEVRDEVLIFDGGSPDIVTLDAATMAMEKKLMGPAAAMGKFDSVVAGDRLWTLDAANSITAYHLGTGNVLQTFDLSVVGERQFWQGLAVY